MQNHETIAITTKEFDDLLEYSASLPTGTTIGKRWKAHRVHDGLDYWLMGEYTPHLDPEMVGIKWRKIIVNEIEQVIGDYQIADITKMYQGVPPPKCMQDSVDWWFMIGQFVAEYSSLPEVPARIIVHGFMAVMVDYTRFREVRYEYANGDLMLLDREDLRITNEFANKNAVVAALESAIANMGSAPRIELLKWRLPGDARESESGFEEIR